MEIDDNIVWCPKCKIEYHAWVKTCSDCLVDLVSELSEEDISLRDQLDPLELLVSVADEGESEAITSLLAINGIQVIRKQNEDDDAVFVIDLYVSESLIRKALTILHCQDDAEGESFFGDDVEDGAMSEVEMTQGEHGGYTGLQLFKECFADEQDKHITLAPGRNFLRISGALYIISSVFSMFNIAGMVINNITFDLLLVFALVLLFFGYCLFAGIMGVKYCNSVNKASFLCILIIIDLLIRVFVLIGYAVLGLMLAGGLDGLIVGFILAVFILPLPITYLVGAQKNRLAKRKGIVS